MEPVNLEFHIWKTVLFKHEDSVKHCRPTKAKTFCWPLTCTKGSTKEVFRLKGINTRWKLRSVEQNKEQKAGFGVCLSVSPSVQFSHSVVPDFCNPMNGSMPGLPVHHQLLEFTQTHVHWVSDAIQPSHPLSSPSSPALNLSQHQGLFQWVSSSSQVAKVLEFQLQHQSFQWRPRTDLL